MHVLYKLGIPDMSVQNMPPRISVAFFGFQVDALAAEIRQLKVETEGWAGLVGGCGFVVFFVG